MQYLQYLLELKNEKDQITRNINYLMYVRR